MKVIAESIKQYRVRRSGRWLDRRFDTLEETELALIALTTAKVMNDLSTNLNAELAQCILKGPEFSIEERYHYYFGLKTILQEIIDKQERRRKDQIEKSKYDPTYFTENRKILVPLESAERIFRDTNRLLIVALGASIDRKTEKIARGLWNKLAHARKRVFDQLDEEAARLIRRLGYGPLGLSPVSDDLSAIRSSFVNLPMPEPWFMNASSNGDVLMAA